MLKQGNAIDTSHLQANIHFPIEIVLLGDLT